MNGPYIVFDDWSTYAGADGCTFVYIPDSEQKNLEGTNDFQSVDENNDKNVIINIDDLVDAYNQIHGTKL